MGNDRPHTIMAPQFQFFGYNFWITFWDLRHEVSQNLQKEHISRQKRDFM